MNPPLLIPDGRHKPDRADRRTDHTGKVFGLLTVVRFHGSVGEGRAKRAVWLCRCKCGREKLVRAELLLRKTKPVTHCGCQKTVKPRQTRPLPRSRPVSSVSTPRTASKPPQEAPDAGNIARSSGFVSEKRPPSGDWKTSLIVASRRSNTKWSEISELVDLPVDECQRIHQKATFIQTHAA